MSFYCRPIENIKGRENGKWYKMNLQKIVHEIAKLKRGTVLFVASLFITTFIKIKGDMEISK